MTAIILSGCTLVVIHGGSPSYSLEPGIFKIEPDKNAHVVTYRLVGIGIVPGRDGTTLGFRRETGIAAYNAKDCRLIVFRPRNEDIESITKLL